MLLLRLLEVFVGFTAASALQRTPSTPPRAAAAASEAVVVLMKQLDACRVKRTIHLKLTASGNVNRDVWVLYDSGFTPKSTDELSKILQEVDVFLAPQPSVDEASMPGASSFEKIPGAVLGGASRALQGSVASQQIEYTPRSGSARAAFVRWAVDASIQHSYRNIWLVDDDTLFTGKWHKLFDTFTQSDADVVSKLTQADNDDGQRMLRNCRISTSVPCPLRDAAKVQMSAIRFSPRYLSALQAALADKNGAHGHHEGLIYAFCKHNPWCHHTSMPEDLEGIVTNGGWGNYMCDKDGCNSCTLGGLIDLSGGNASLPDRIYHPVKCEWDRCGDPAVGSEALGYAEVADEEIRALESRMLAARA